MFSVPETEVMAAYRIAEMRDVILPAAERQTSMVRELESGALRPGAPAWRTAAGWLGTRLVAAGARVQALGTVAVQPGT